MLLVAVLILGAAFYYFTARYLGETAREEMFRAGRLAQNAIRRNLDGAALTSKLISQNYELHTGLQSGSPGAVSRLIGREIGAVEADFVSVAGADGVVFCHTTRLKHPPEVAAAARSEPLFLSPAFQSVTRDGMARAGIEPVYPNSIGVIAIAPVYDDEFNFLGFVRIGYYLDKRFVENVRALADTDLAIEYRGDIISSSVDFPESERPVKPEKLEERFLIHRMPVMSGNRRIATLLALYPKSRIARVQRRGLSAILLVTVLAFAVSALVSTRMSQRIVGPLNELTAGAGRLQDGDFAHRIPHVGRDELGALADAFNRMAESLEQRDAEIRSNQEQLIESGKLAAIGELAAGVAHEIGNPLSAIFGYIQLLRDAPPEKRNHYLEEMSKEAGFIDSTIRELLEFSRPSKIENEMLSLEDAVDEALRMLSFHKSMKYIDVTRERSQEPPLVIGSHKELVQAVLNIALNAAQAMHGKGRIVLRTEVSDVFATLRVRDTGPGIPDTDMPHIFEPFYTTKRSGTGLGLSITYRIVERHNGKIQVETSPETGTTFSLIFPRQTERKTV